MHPNIKVCFFYSLDFNKVEEFCGRSFNLRAIFMDVLKAYFPYRKIKKYSSHQVQVLVSHICELVFGFLDEKTFNSSTTCFQSRRYKIVSTVPLIYYEIWILIYDFIIFHHIISSHLSQWSLILLVVLFFQINAILILWFCVLAFDCKLLLFHDHGMLWEVLNLHLFKWINHFNDRTSYWI